MHNNKPNITHNVFHISWSLYSNTVTLYLFQIWDLTVQTFLFHSRHLHSLGFLQNNSLFLSLQTLTSQEDGEDEDARHETEEGAELHDSWQHYQHVERARHVLRKF